MKMDVDIAVIGAGPAGANAALTACRARCSVALIDEQQAPGGQVWRAKSAAIQSAPTTPETTAGDALRSAVQRSEITHLSNCRVWQIAPGHPGWTLSFVRDGGAGQLTCRSLVLALGARDFVQPVPGWTTPGVLGLGGVTAMLKQSLSPPGKKTVVSGTGPLVFFVASEIRRLGGRVAAIVTPNARRDWAWALPYLVRRPGDLARGAVWLADLKLGRVPIFWCHAVTRVHGGQRVSGVSIAPLDRDWSPAGDESMMEADSLCLGNGLVPNIDAPRMLGVGIEYRAGLGGWVPETGQDGQTPVPGLYLCGDGAGIRGAAAAAQHGQLAGNRAAADLGHAGDLDRDKVHAEWTRAANFGSAMTGLSVMRSGLCALTTSGTTVCRCENVDRATLEREVDSGASSVNAIKSGSRAGMGPCGGKFCVSAIAQVIAARTGTPIADIPPPTPRAPLMPVGLGAVAGEFEYEDLPIPKPAPL